jgi:putative restriction endonuclease
MVAFSVSQHVKTTCRAMSQRPQLVSIGPCKRGFLEVGWPGPTRSSCRGGYEDDEDHGDVIVYTGHGGKDRKTGKQIRDQQLTLGNLALARSHLEGLPVRVIRGAELDSPYAPATGYRYDGLYIVEEHWVEPGRSGFLVWRYRLGREGDQPVPWPPTAEPASPAGLPKKTKTTILRILRSTPKARHVKERHHHRCQVCGTQILTKGGPYAEGAHVKGLGAPHNGPDVEDNILCLCPNHHVMFDAGSFSIADDLSLLGLSGRLRVVKGHSLNPAYLAYHRVIMGFRRSPRRG